MYIRWNVENWCSHYDNSTYACRHYIIIVQFIIPRNDLQIAAVPFRFGTLEPDFEMNRKMGAHNLCIFSIVCSQFAKLCLIDWQTKCTSVVLGCEIWYLHDQFSIQKWRRTNKYEIAQYTFNQHACHWCAIADHCHFHTVCACMFNLEPIDSAWSVRWFVLLCIHEINVHTIFNECQVNFSKSASHSDMTTLNLRFDFLK